MILTTNLQLCFNLFIIFNIPLFKSVLKIDFYIILIYKNLHYKIKRTYVSVISVYTIYTVNQYFINYRTY